jgi:hypothetical protein
MIMLVPKRDKVTREWGKLHDMGGAWNTYEEEDRHIHVFLGGKRTFGLPRHRWKDNIKMDLQEVE